MLIEKVRKYYLEQDYNCAETVVKAANEEYNLGLTDSAVRLVSGYGKGFGACETCGALCGAMAVLSVMCVQTRAHETENFSDICSGYLSAFKAKLGSDNCQQLQDKYRNEQVRCLKTIELAAQALEDYLIKLGKVAAPEGKTTVSKEDITRVKALGFLLNKGTDNFNGRVITRNGRITVDEAMAVAQAAQLYGDGHVEMTSRMTLEVSGIPYDKIEDFRAYLAKAGLETGGTGSKVRPVVSCKGTTCHYGLIDTFGLSDSIHQRFYKGYANVKLPHKFKIAVGGCPNNCVKPDLNDLGVIGQRVPQVDEDKCKGCKVCQVEKECPLGDAKVIEKDSKRILAIDTAECNHCGRCVGKCPFGAVTSKLDGYKVYLGGRWGKKTAKGQSMDTVFTTSQQVMDVIEKAILLFRRDGISGERFNDTVNRLGFENVQQMLMSDELLKQKNEILKDENSPEGGATC